MGSLDVRKSEELRLSFGMVHPYMQRQEEPQAFDLAILVIQGKGADGIQGRGMKIRPICLPKFDTVIHGQKMYTAGECNKVP